MLGKTWERDDLGSGRRQLTLYQRPICYDDAGAWQRIVNDFVAGDASWPHVVTAAPMLIYAAADGKRRICPTREADRYIEIGAPYIKPATQWQKVSLGAATRSGNVISWSTAQADVQAIMGGHVVKLLVALKGGWTPPNSQFAFPVDLVGLTRTGRAIYRDGVQVASIGEFIVYETASGRRREGRLCTTELVRVSGQWYVLCTLPSLAGMSAPVLDPTLTIQPDATAGLDNSIESAMPDSNQATDTYFLSGQADAWGPDIYHGLIKFDLSSLPASAVILSTTFSLCVQDNFSMPNGMTLAVHRLKRAWVETQATWNIYSAGNSWQTAGGTGANDYESTPLGTVALVASETLNAFKNISLAGTSKAAIDLGNGWLTKATVETSGSDHMKGFYSSDATTASYRPKLVIVYVDYMFQRQENTLLRM